MQVVHVDAGEDGGREEREGRYKMLRGRSEMLSRGKRTTNNTNVTVKDRETSGVAIITSARPGPGTKFSALRAKATGS